jgi:hypothetical protein
MADGPGIVSTGIGFPIEPYNFPDVHYPSGAGHPTLSPSSDGALVVIPMAIVMVFATVTGPVTKMVADGWAGVRLPQAKIAMIVARAAISPEKMPTEAGFLPRSRNCAIIRLRVASAVSRAAASLKTVSC